MNLLPGEKILFTSQDGQLQLTNFRLRKFVNSGPLKEIASIFLENLSSAKLKAWDHKIFIYLGIAAIVGSLALGRQLQLIAPGVFVGVVFLIAYFFSRREFFEL